MTSQPQGTMASLPITRPEFGEEEIDALRTVLASGWVTQGPATREFERLFAARHQVDHALATTSCTAALHLAVMALDLKPHDEVIVPSFTWVTSAHCAEYVGARAVFCDIDPITMNLDVASAAALITPRTRALIPIHLFGLPADMEAVNALGARHSLGVIEDAACAVGSSYKGEPVGGFGDIGCFSFHPRKVITTGEGGMVTTRAADLAARVGALRNHGANPRLTPRNPKPYQMGVFDQLGFNLRLSDIQAAVGVAQMAKLDRLLEHRVRMAHGYHERLRGLNWLRIPEAAPGYEHTYQSYVIWVQKHAPLARNAIMEELAKKGIQTRPGTLAVHCIPYYRDRYGLKPQDYPASHAAQESTITLPIFPGMTDAHLDFVTESLRALQQAPYTVRRAS